MTEKQVKSLETWQITTKKFGSKDDGFDRAFLLGYITSLFDSHLISGTLAIKLMTEIKNRSK